LSVGWRGERAGGTLSEAAACRVALECGLSLASTGVVLRVGYMCSGAISAAWYAQRVAVRRQDARFAARASPLARAGGKWAALPLCCSFAGKLPAARTLWCMPQLTGERAPENTLKTARALTLIQQNENGLRVCGLLPPVGNRVCSAADGEHIHLSFIARR